MRYIINKTSSGIVFKCDRCEKIHVEFNNINFNFTEGEYREFVCYLENLDGLYWEEKNRQSVFSRKIRIPFGGTSICLMLNVEELDSLRNLLAFPTLSAQQGLLMQFNKMQCFN